MHAAAPLLSRAEAPADSANPAADPAFREPYVDTDEWHEEPVRHRYVHGGFRGTDTRFSLYLPPRERYQGRFFQHITPVPDSENLAQGNFAREEDKLAFAIASGAYHLETNGGGARHVGVPGIAGDPTITAYRANAAAARYSRVVAQRIYGAHRSFGYAYGGSGGGYRTIGSMENTRGVWDGAVPYVIGSTMSIPNMFTVRMHAMRILRDRFDQIVDALEPGGSGDMYAGLTQDERAALREVTRMGFEPRSWFGHRTMGVHAFTVLYSGMLAADPTYFEDFWRKPGYLGFDHPESFAGARMRFRTQVEALLGEAAARARGLDIRRIPGTARGAVDTAWAALVGDGSGRPVAIELGSAPPELGFQGGDLLVLSGEAAGERVEARAVQGDSVVLGVVDPAVLAKIRPGDGVQLDNSNFLAAQTYHRHQVPGPEFEAWDQFRGPDGKPLFPQRPVILGPLFVQATAGSLQTGRFDGRMIVVESLWDREALPWQADWYRERVKEHFGERIDENFRLWYVDRALHPDEIRQEDETRTVSYLPVLQQALRDLARWVEKGVAPPASTNYRYDDGQIVVPATAAQRRGVQAVVMATVDGRERADVAVGQNLEFAGIIEVPPGAGSVIRAEWDFEGSGDYPVVCELDGDPREPRRVAVRASHAFGRPGTYFPTVRAYTERDADGTVFARIRNLARVRVVVK